MKERIGYIDGAKAIGIWLVIMGHCSNTTTAYPHLVSIIYLFHMPLFFIISGFLFSEKKSQDFCVFSKMGGGKYVKSYVRPFIVASIATFLVLLTFCFLKHIVIWPEVKRLITAISWGAGWSGDSQVFGWMPAIGPIWFLLALFWACVIYSLVNKWFKGIDKAVVIVGLFSFGMFSSRFIILPWSIQSGCCAVIYLYIGNLIRKYDLLNKKLSWESILILIGLVLFCSFKGGIAMNACVYEQGFISVIASVASCLAVFFIINKTGFVGGWTGRNTLCLMCGNQIVDYLNYFYRAGSVFKDITHISIVNFLCEFVVCLLLTYLFGFIFYKSRLIAH